ncbi:alpha/beta hydrolase [Rhodococcoides trifolii]|uniref:Alpha/beta hydrolase n=2 Tax=Rhodococcoides trifolii TaxID=908250 RepID=A0A917G048_9NOCA|nr:alpha/beta hydrolase [Rhodococcus trifolii]
MLFLHGMGAAGVPAFGEVATDRAFEGRLRLLPDLLGFGFSDRPRDFDYSLVSHAVTVADLLDDSGLRDVDVVGHSMGGSIAVELAARRPDLVRSLAVLEPNLEPWDGGASVLIAQQSEEGFVDTGFAELLSDVDTEWAATLRICDPRALHRSAVGLCTSSVLDSLLKLTTRCVYIYGELTGAPNSVETIRGAGVRIERIDDAGHNMMADNAHAVVEVIHDFVGDGGRTRP